LQLKKFQPILLPLLAGLLFYLGWPTSPFTFAVFGAFVPLLIIEQTSHNRLSYFGQIYLALFIWNLTTTWWIWNASLVGAWLAIFVNALLMCLPWMGYRSIKQQLGQTIGLISLIVFWIGFEYLHLQDWGLSWPWLTLGNALANQPDWIQWYEWTGVAGGSLWILIVNILLFTSFFAQAPHNTPKKNQRLSFLKPALICIIVLIPVIGSFLMHPNKPQEVSPSKDIQNIVLVQPNIDPYEKLSAGTFEMQLQRLLELSASKIDSNTTLLVWPETALYSPSGFDENELKNNSSLQPLFDFLHQHPRLHLFTGIESYRLFREKVSLYARPLEGTGTYYEMYNGSVLLDSSGPLQFYHKSMLVPGVETLPRFLLFLAPVFEKFGGSTGGYARQPDRTPVRTKNHFIIAPAICYESIYGEYLSRYMQKGANIIAIITNDGWWGNTPGYQQHLAYARLRAIETRRWVVRSANTGISCFISPEGTIYEAQPWWQEAAAKMSVSSTNHSTIFVQWGDWISKIALVASVLFIAGFFVQRINVKRKS